MKAVTKKDDFIPEMIFEVKCDDIKNFAKKYIGISDLNKIGSRVDYGLLKIFSLFKYKKNQII